MGTIGRNDAKQHVSPYEELLGDPIIQMIVLSDDVAREAIVDLAAAHERTASHTIDSTKSSTGAVTLNKLEKTG